MSATIAWNPSATADSLPRVVLEADPRLARCNPETFIYASKSQCPIYRYSNTLAYKTVCKKRETKLMVAADDIALAVVSKIGIVDGISSQWYQKGAIMELGYPLEVNKILPAERISIARHMIILVTRLHERGIIHGDIRPENFVKRPGEECLHMAEFSSARMIDDSDLNTWPSDISAIQYTSPNRGKNGEPSTVFDDYFALAVSIWAVFSGENPMVGLFNSNEGHMPDLTKITDDELFCSVIDVLEEGGLKVNCPGTLSRRNTLGIDRTISFPLSLFDVDLDNSDEPGTVKSKPRFCQHCFQIALSNADRINSREPERPVEYPEFCHLKTSTQNKESVHTNTPVLQEDAVSEYALNWLKGQDMVPANQSLVGSSLNPNRGLGPHPKSPGQKPNLCIKTERDQEVEKPISSATTTVTIIAADRMPGRYRSNTAAKIPPAVPSESDEGYGSITQGSSSAASMGSISPSRSFQRTMSHWSESSCGSSGEGEEEDETGSSDCSSPLRTPMAAKFTRSQVTSSFESVELTDVERQCM